MCLIGGMDYWIDGPDANPYEAEVEIEEEEDESCN